VVDGAHRSSGITVVDLCRDAMGVILSAHLHLDAGEDAKVIEKDLGALIAKLPPESKLFRAAADVVCKLHPRGKSNEQQRLGTRDVTDADGAFVIWVGRVEPLARVAPKRSSPRFLLWAGGQLPSNAVSYPQFLWINLPARVNDTCPAPWAQSTPTCV
jgi:hypothetical protein